MQGGALMWAVGGAGLTAAADDVAWAAPTRRGSFSKLANGTVIEQVELSNALGFAVRI